MQLYEYFEHLFKQILYVEVGHSIQIFGYIFFCFKMKCMCPGAQFSHNFFPKETFPRQYSNAFSHGVGIRTKKPKVKPQNSFLKIELFFLRFYIAIIFRCKPQKSIKTFTPQTSTEMPHIFGKNLFSPILLLRILKTLPYTHPFTLTSLPIILLQNLLLPLPPPTKQNHKRHITAISS